MPSPEHESVVSSVRAQQTGPPPSSVAEMRASLDLLVDYYKTLEFPDGVEETPANPAGVPASWFTPKSTATTNAAPCTILYLHGGGYVMGSVATHRSLIGRIAKAAGVRCLALDYRLAPEHPFPAAIDDVRAVYAWLLDQGVGPDEIILAGDSAGGGLTLASLVSMRDAGVALPAAAFCLSPLADLEMTGESARGDIDDPMVDRHGTGLMAEAYLQGTSARDPRASPIHADFSGFPPLLIEVGTRELLLDDARRVAARAREAGVDVTVEEGEGLTHVWQLHPQLPESRDSVERIAKFVRTSFGSSIEP